MNNEKFTGVTTIRINERIDCGEILMQKKILIDKSETESSLRAKILKQEHKLYSQSIISIFK